VKKVTTAAVQDFGNLWNEDTGKLEYLINDASPEEVQQGAQMLIEETIDNSWWGGILGWFVEGTSNAGMERRGDR